MIDRKFLIAGNWKMNGMFDSISEVCKIDQHSKELNSEIIIEQYFFIFNLSLY